MSNYWGDDTLESWLAYEVFNCDESFITPEIVALFERWRGGIESGIREWMESDWGNGRRSWRAADVAGFIPAGELEAAEKAGREILLRKS